MAGYLIRRLFAMAITLLALSAVCFFIIQLPPGDFLSAYVANIAAQGETVDPEFVKNLRAQYGLDQPFHVQYFSWLGNVLQGDLGFSFNLGTPVVRVFEERLGISLLVESIAVVVTWAIAIPIGIYSAVRQYSPGDMVATIFGFIGLAVPNFLLALLIMYLVFITTGSAIDGLFSAEFVQARWSLARIWDFLSHVWIAVLVIATGASAQIIRVLRANLLDELHKPYVVTARAKGLKESTVVFRYPVRVAMTPLIATIGWLLPTVISSSIVTSIVLNLPTLSPILLRSLLTQDMHLAGALIMFMGVLTVVGTLVSDLLLIWVDPRIRISILESGKA